MSDGLVEKSKNPLVSSHIENGPLIVDVPIKSGDFPWFRSLTKRFHRGTMTPLRSVFDSGPKQQGTIAADAPSPDRAEPGRMKEAIYFTIVYC